MAGAKLLNFDVCVKTKQTAGFSCSGWLSEELGCFQYWQPACKSKWFGNVRETFATHCNKHCLKLSFKAMVRFVQAGTEPAVRGLAFWPHTGPHDHHILMEPSAVIGLSLYIENDHIWISKASRYKKKIGSALHTDLCCHIKWALCTTKSGQAVLSCCLFSQQTWHNS